MLLKNVKKIILILMTILTLSSCSNVSKNIKHNISKSINFTENQNQKSLDFDEKESPNFYKIIGEII